MASVSFSVEVSVDKRLSRYLSSINQKREIKLTSRTQTIDNLLKKAGF